MNKTQLRSKFLKKRQEFIPFKKPSDQKIFQKFINLPIVKKSKTICFYVSKVGEVNTHELIKYYLGETVSFRVAPLRVQPSKAKRIVVPKVFGKNLKLYEIKKFSDLSPGSFGILEPKVSSRLRLPRANRGARTINDFYPSNETPHQMVQGEVRSQTLKNNAKNLVDLFVIPGIVFSQSGQRLGFGKGYYDCLLKNTKGFKLGLAYSWQIVDKLPEEKEDMLMDMVLTED